MLEAKFILEIDKDSLKVDIQGDMISLAILFFLACEENKNIEKIIKTVIESIDLYNKNKNEAREVPEV